MQSAALVELCASAPDDTTRQLLFEEVASSGSGLTDLLVRFDLPEIEDLVETALDRTSDDGATQLLTSCVLRGTRKLPARLQHRILDRAADLATSSALLGGIGNIEDVGVIERIVRIAIDDKKQTFGYPGELPRKIEQLDEALVAKLARRVVRKPGAPSHQLALNLAFHPSGKISAGCRGELVALGWNNGTQALVSWFVADGSVRATPTGARSFASRIGAQDDEFVNELPWMELAQNGPAADALFDALVVNYADVEKMLTRIKMKQYLTDRFHREIKDPNQWRMLLSMGGSWDGSFADLLETIRAV